MHNSIGIKLAEIMLPDKTIDLNKWSVIACDQYTSNKAYWHRVREHVGDAPSTLELVYPEAYLNDNDNSNRINSISNAMRNYIRDGLLITLAPQFIYTERTTSSNQVRRGLIVALDLEQYDYNAGAASLTRATEGTVLDRLPPRIAIRREAILESPHIMVLFDDPDRSVIEPLAEQVSEMDKLYDFSLMMNGGHITGYGVDDQSKIENIYSALDKLAKPEVFQSKYDVDKSKPVMLFAVGDGNHSLAAAKAYWNELKATMSPSKIQDHPARYALVELINVHDDGLSFEPIHRVLFNINVDKVLKEFCKYNLSAGIDTSIENYSSLEKAKAAYKRHRAQPEGHLILYASKDKYGLLKADKPACNLEVGTLQAFLDAYLEEHKDSDIDYIHGEDETLALASDDNCIGFLLPVMEKHDLFKTIILDGVLPRKTFSMGEADDKRFYLECRKITI